MFDRPPESHPAFRPILGAFELHEPVGRGGMGVVWRATHRGPDATPAAIKVLTHERAAHPRHVEALRFEVRATASLDHPSVIRLYDTGVVGAGAERATEGALAAGSPWLAMAWVPGGRTLARHVRQHGRLAWSELRPALEEVLEALAHAHARDVIHRDLKPGNVLLTPERRRVLTDFGIAMALDDPDGRTPLASGTPAYMAPEQIRQRLHEIGPWTDLYALGCLAFAVATGAPPFLSPDPTDPTSVLEAHLFLPPPPFPDTPGVPARFGAWVQCLLEKQPSRRFACAADALAALRGLDVPQPTDLGVERPAAPVQAAPTLETGSATFEWTVPPCSDASTAPPRATAAWRRPEVPRDWRRSSDRRRPLAGAGIGLFGLRAVPVVGRTPERELLWSALLAARAEGRPRAVVLSGPAGVGKSRLARWVEVRARECGAAQGLRVYHGPVPGPRFGLRDLFARWIGTAGSEARTVRRRATQALAALGMDDPEDGALLAEWLGAGASAGSAPRAQRDALALRVLVHIARQRPLLLWLDDVQWGREALRVAARLLDAPVPALLVLTVRERDATGEARTLLDALEAHPRVASHALPPLGRAESRRLIDHLLELDARLADEAAARTAGMPLFAIQLVGDWVDRDALEAGPQGWRLRAGANLPVDLRALWVRRIDGLPAGSREALEVAAALGARVVTADWRRACARAGLEVPVGLLDQLARARLVARTERGFAFAHGELVDSLALRSRAEGRWAEAHAACAHAVEAQYELEHPLTRQRLLRHHLEAGAYGAAVDQAVEAVLAFYKTGELRTARECLALGERASAHLGLEPDDERWYRLRMASARVAMAAGRLAEVTSIAVEVAEHARSGGFHDHLAAALRQHGNALSLLGRHDESDEKLRAARGWYLALDDAGNVGNVLHQLASNAVHLGRVAEAERHLDEAEARFLAGGRPESAAFCWAARAELATYRRDWAGARSAADLALEVWIPARRRWRVANLRGLKASVDMWTGRFEEAEETFAWIERELQRLGVEGLAADISRGARGHLAVYRGRYDEARPRLEPVLEGLSTSGWALRIPGIAMALALCDAVEGELAAAADRVQVAERCLESSPQVDPSGCLMATHVHAALDRAGHTELANRAGVLAKRQAQRLGWEARSVTT